MAHDELLRLTGSTNNPEETITATADGTGVYVGKGRAVRAALRIGGTVTGTNPTLDVVIQTSATLGGSYVTRASFPQQTATDVLQTGAMPASGINRLVFATPEDEPYVRVSKTIGGTSTPTFRDVSVILTPVEGPFAT